MTDERFQRVEELFLTASELEPERRREFLDEACGDDSSLRAEVEGLLAQDADPYELMKTLAFGKGVQRAAEKALDAVAATGCDPGEGQPVGLADGRRAQRRGQRELRWRAGVALSVGGDRRRRMR